MLLAQLGSHADLLAQARAMLDAHDHATGVLDPRTDAWLGIGGPDLLALGGQKIGRYRLDSLIAEGAMAAVYRATQSRPDRVVALKLFRTALPLVDARHRFRREAQALARLTHPNIARIYEAGLHEIASSPSDSPFPAASPEAPRALPFIAMEFVDGSTITTFANSNKLDDRARIRLMLQVIDAVEAAHQQAVIHRDIKPGNVLVDQTGTVKVLDFGIARVAGEADSATWQTTSGVLLGTPGYMSPEQAAGQIDEIDVRTDVWALGVLLFELLTGHQPIDAKHTSITELLRKLETEEPRRLTQLRPDLRGDLDTLLATALERDKSRRYPSAAALGLDLQRFLAQRPIEARPATRLYVAGKFIRRNRIPLAFGAVLLGSLLGGSVASWIGFARAVDAKRQAEANAILALQSADRERQSARHAEAAQQHAEELSRISDAAARRASAVSAFLVDLLRSPDPNRDGRTITVYENIKQSLPKIPERFNNSPESEADVRHALARTLFELGDYDLAREQMERVVDIRHPGWRDATPSLDALNDINLLLEIIRWQYKPDEARAIAEPIWERIKDVHPLDSQIMLSFRGARAGIAYDLGEYERSAELYEAQLADHRRVNAPDDDNLITSLNNLSNVYVQFSRYDRANELLEEALLHLRNKYGPDSPTVIVAEFNHARNLGWMGRNAECLERLQANAEKSVRVFGPAHDQSIIVRRSIGDVLSNLGRDQEALDVLDAVTADASQAFGEAHDITLKCQHSRALILKHLNRLDEAEAILRRCIELDAQSSPNPTRVIINKRTLIDIISLRGDHARALEEYNQFLNYVQHAPGELYSLYAAKLGRAQTLYMLERYDEAAADFTESADGFSQIQSPYESSVALRGKARALIRLNRFDEAKTILDSTWAFLQHDPRTTVRERSISAYIDYYTQLNDAENLAHWQAQLDALNAPLTP
jgi:tetratricopeptide (TPR) repeat protein